MTSTRTPSSTPITLDRVFGSVGIFKEILERLEDLEEVLLKGALEDDLDAIRRRLTSLERRSTNLEADNCGGCAGCGKENACCGCEPVTVARLRAIRELLVTWEELDGPITYASAAAALRHALDG